MKTNQLRSIIFVAGLLVLSGSMLAHHGTNISYDHDKPTQLSGIVTEFVWSNPHAQIYFDVTDATGKVVKWAGELNSPGVLGRAGWSRRTFKAGDKITLTVFPSKAGASVGVVDQSKGVVLNGTPLPRERND